MGIVPVTAFGQTWNGSVDNNWFTGSNWTGGVAPNSASAVVVIDNVLNNPVFLNADASVFSLTLGSGDSLDQSAGLFRVSGGTIDNSGAFGLGGQMQLSGSDLTLSGSGVFTMNAGQIGGDSANRTLFNQSTIDGSGLIGSNVGALYQAGFSLSNSGTIDADATGSTLLIQGGGSTFTNSGLLEATNGGILTLSTSAPLADAGGAITASGSGSTVNLNVRVQGGTLNTAAGGVIQTGGAGATLDGDTSGPMTLSSGSTYTAGTSGLTRALGTLTLDAGSTLALTGQLQVQGADLTLAGSGVLTLSGAGAQIGGDSAARTLNNEILIQGTGVIGSNVGSLFQAGFSLNNSGTIDANASGGTLVIQGGGLTFTNSGLLEATNGGILNLIASNAVLMNSGAAITASGADSVVLVNMQVQGGTLTTANGGAIETGASGAFLNGSAAGALTLSDGTAYTAGTNGLTRAVGTLDFGSGATLALSGQLQLAGGDLTLAGPGSVVMSGSAAQIGGDGSARTLNNALLIEGAGVIGSNIGSLFQAGFSLNNSGTIDADVSGSTLVIQGGGGAFTNTGLLEATNGGTLSLSATAPLSEAGGMITASGAGSTVNVNMRIEGGTLNTAAGGVIQTGPAGATLDGDAAGPITLSGGSTYTAGTNALTRAAGTLILDAGSTLALTGQLQLQGADLTLTGSGALILSGSGAQIGGDGSARTLNNAALVEGSGLIGSNAGSLFQTISVINDANGTLLANVAGGTLTVAGTGGLTNDGLMRANAGATLNATQGFTNFSSGTLTGGSYAAYSGDIQINALGSTGGEIVTNNAHVLLSGPTGIVSDAAGLNALSQLATNASGASLTIENGNAFVSGATAPFTNHGSVSVDSASTFAVLSNYIQSGASSSTKVDGTLTPGGGAFTMASGRLTGSGLVAASVTNSGGVVDPGDTVGDLRVSNYEQGSGGSLQIDIASATSNDLLTVDGSAVLAGLLNPVLKGGYTPTLGDSFVFLQYVLRSGEFSGISNDIFDNGQFMWGVTYNATDAVLTVERGPSVSAAPEPSIWVLMISSIGLMGLMLRRKTKSRGRPKFASAA